MLSSVDLMALKILRIIDTTMTMATSTKKGQNMENGSGNISTQ